MFKKIEHHITTNFPLSIEQENEFKYELIDDDFTSVFTLDTALILNDWMVKVGTTIGAGEIIETSKSLSIIDIYTEKQLEVGKNLALFIIWSKHYSDKLVIWQDEHCPKYVENWEEIKRERDKFLLLK